MYKKCNIPQVHVSEYRRNYRLRFKCSAFCLGIQPLLTPSSPYPQVVQLYGRYIQSEHQRKALVWQKRYLLVVIKGFSDTEQHTRSRLTAMAPLHLFPSTSVHHQARQSKGMFRWVELMPHTVLKLSSLI